MSVVLRHGRQKREARLHAIHVFRVSALKQGVDARVKPGHDESRDLRRMIREYAQML
ncbi:MAG: hypothetical protein J0H75_05825 [Rhizobiales bacterium]|nr:hypothetical protein [Hyphomicrobiales bacterium]